MKRPHFFIFAILIIFCLKNSRAEEIRFVSVPNDSSVYNILTWQKPNRYRPVIILDGKWQYRIPSENIRGEVTIPSSCQFQGEVIFQRTFNPDTSLQNHLFRLVCYGINYYCEIFINNKFIGSHAGGYSSFYIDIPKDFIFFHKDNIVEIKVDTRLDGKTSIPQLFQANGIKNTFGIFRSIFLVAQPELFIDNPAITYKLNTDFSRCDVNVQFELYDRGNYLLNLSEDELKKERLSYQIELFSQRKKNLVFKTINKLDYSNYQLKKLISANFTLKNFQLWSPESPALYLLRIKLIQNLQVIDQIDQQIGFRQLDFFNGNIFLNGERFFIKGINWVEDYKIDGSLFNREQLFKDLELIKQLHANAIRVLNHPPHPYVVYMCDSLGLLLLQELPLNSIPPRRLNSEVFRSRITDYLLEMISRDRFNVSLLGIGIGENLLPDNKNTQQFLEYLYRKIISTLEVPVYTNFSPPIRRGTVLPGSISGISLFNLDKAQILKKLPGWLNQNLSHPMLVLSFGAPKLGNPKNVEDDADFQKYQVLKIARAWETITGYPEIDGCFISCISDYYGNYASTLYGNNSDPYLKPVGVTDYQREKRFAFKALKSLYQEGKCRYNPTLKFEQANPEIFPILGIISLLIFLFILNNRRYFRENFKRIFIHSHGFYTDLRDGRKIPFSHTALIALFSSLGCGMVIGSILFFLRDQPIFDHLSTLILLDPFLKEQFSRIVWKPGPLIFLGTVLTVVYFIVFAILFRLFGFIAQKKVTFGRLLILSFWLGSNYFIFLPIGMILFRLLQYQNLFSYTLIFLAFVDIWYFSRVIKGLRVVFTITFWQTLALVCTIIIVLSAGFLYYYQMKIDFINYLLYYFSILKVYFPLI